MHQLVVTYGSSPHLEFLEGRELEGWPGAELDVVDAESEAAAGYLLTQELRNALPHRQVVQLLTQVRVDINDPEFRQPTALIGPALTEELARRNASARNWLLRSEGSGWRHVVPAPKPLAVLEADAVLVLLEAGVLVVSSGGGGIPVVADFAGHLRGVAAVIDAALTASVLAQQIGADRLVLLTAGDARLPTEKTLTVMSAAEVLAAAAEGSAPTPQMLAAGRFVEATGKVATIGDLRSARGVLDGNVGIMVVADSLDRAGQVR
jgi:carbamate kinase